jgi:2-polyprenyl-3-methyl-5-hydroxy-6-metoxy-1,4-benzoquinol methylase
VQALALDFLQWLDCSDPSFCISWPVASGSHVLVPGAGLGRLAFELAADQGHKVTALDIRWAQVLVAFTSMSGSLQAHRGHTYVTIV